MNPEYSLTGQQIAENDFLGNLIITLLALFVHLLKHVGLLIYRVSELVCVREMHLWSLLQTAEEDPLLAYKE